MTATSVGIHFFAKSALLECKDIPCCWCDLLSLVRNPDGTFHVGNTQVTAAVDGGAI